MYHTRCRTDFILKLRIEVSATANLRVCKNKIKLNSIYTRNYKVISANEDQTLKFYCGACERDILDIGEDIVSECTECYSTSILNDLGFVDTKESPICKKCYEKSFSDEEFKPMVDVLANLRIEL